MSETDPVLRAFEFLRHEHGPALADPALEARLLERFERRRPRRRRRILFLLPTVAVLAGATFAAAGGVRWLRGWWFRVEVDGRPIEGAVDGDGERTFEVETADGGKATVHVSRERERVGGATRTRIGIDRAGPQGLDVERSESVVGGAAGTLLPASTVTGVRPFFAGRDAAGGRVELYGPADGAGGSRLLVRRPDADPEHVLELARLPFEVLSDGVRAEITERADGALALEFTYGRGAVLALVVGAPRDSATPSSALATQDGAIRVEVHDSPTTGLSEDERR